MHECPTCNYGLSHTLPDVINGAPFRTCKKKKQDVDKQFYAFIQVSNIL